MYNFCVNVTVVIEHIVLLTAARAQLDNLMWLILILSQHLIQLTG